MKRFSKLLDRQKFIIYNKDSSDMSEVKDNSVHLIVTSPPYPMIAKWDELYKCNLSEYKNSYSVFNLMHERLNDTLRECYRILIDGGIACINIGDATRSVEKHFECYPNYARLTINMKQIGFTTLIPIIWKKISNRPNAFMGSGFVPTNGYVSQDCEYIGIYRKGNIRKFKPKDPNRYLSSFTKEERDLWFSQIWEIQGAKNAKETSAFPETIPYRLIKMFSVINDIIIDPFCGTGTTGRVANKLNRNFIGYEINGR